MLGRFLEAKHPDGRLLSPEEVLEEAMTVVAAGSDTTAIALRSILYYIIRDPRVYQKLVEEIDTFANESKISDPITYAESLTMPYFRSCIKEALRLHSPVGYILPREVPKGGSTLAERYFPPGVRNPLSYSKIQTVVGVHAWTIHRDESVFGAEADKFKPERWLESTERTGFMDRYNLAFGHGARICIGKVISTISVLKTEYLYDGNAQVNTNAATSFSVRAR